MEALGLRGLQRTIRRRAIMPPVGGESHPEPPCGLEAVHLFLLRRVCSFVLCGLPGLFFASLDWSASPDDPLDPEYFVTLEEDEWD